MCFSLFIGADNPIPLIPWNEDDKRVYSQNLSEYELPIQGHFSKQHIGYIGSDQGCGCGFRHVTFQNGEWPEESMSDSEEYSDGDKQPNHIQLECILIGLLQTADSIELYSCWDGDFAEPSGGSSQLLLSSIVDNHFAFRERFLYSIANTAEQGAAANP